ncbi:MAG: hypothetical protein HYX45_06975 [Burkholderiales bacterium]|nr:hypothetical protein [Burkholderiales bacterium]
MKKYLISLGLLAGLGANVQAQDIYGGIGLPGLYTLGYAHPVSQSWGVRGEYAGGLSASANGTDNGVRYDATFKSSRAGLFADWFPFNGGFRLVGGVTANDTKLTVNGVGGPNTTIGNVTTDTTGKKFNVNLKYPSTTAYLGLGYGHHVSTKGLGFYADVGVTLGSFTAEIDTDLVGYNGITQADVEAQKKKMHDSLGGLSYLPSVSVGMVYRF